MRVSTARLALVALRVLKVLVFVAGTAELVSITLRAFGGKALLWAFNHMDEARFTSMAMLTGTLHFRNGIAAIGNDDQVYNGAAYTNWGFGVPVLQLPFQAIAGRFPARFPTGFFPDRAIFFFYAAWLVPLLWWTLDRVLAGMQPESTGVQAWTRRAACSWAAAGLVLVYSLYKLTAYRFFLYEETIAYLVVAQLYAVCAYVFVMRSDRLLPVVGLGVAAGFGLLIRPTGLGYFGMWCVLVLLARPRLVPLAALATTVAPFVVFWLWSNHVRSGSPLSFGFENAAPWFPYHYPIQRWGSQCADTLDHAYEGAKMLFNLFFVSTVVPFPPHLTECHFGLEVQDSSWGDPPSPYGNAPFFGVGVLVLLVLILAHQVVRRERRVAVYLPFAAMAFLYVSFVRAGVGFAWRYAGDFWPLVVLVVVQYVLGLPPRASRLLGWRMALVMVLIAFAGYREHVSPELATIKTLEPTGVASLKEHFQTARYGVDPPLPSRVACRDAVNWPYRGGLGWSAGCTVDTFTHVYLGVPKKTDSHYELTMQTEDLAPPSVRVFFNGRNLTAQREGNTYRMPVDIDYGALTAPAVMITVEWTRSYTAPSGRLLWIELA
jgi:hypothetical protein